MSSSSGMTLRRMESRGEFPKRRRLSEHFSHRDIRAEIPKLDIMRFAIESARREAEIKRYANLIWSIDFVMDALEHGRRVPCLAIVDTCARQPRVDTFMRAFFHVT